MSLSASHAILLCDCKRYCLKQQSTTFFNAEVHITNIDIMLSRMFMKSAKDRIYRCWSIRITLPSGSVTIKLAGPVVFSSTGLSILLPLLMRWL